MTKCLLAVVDVTGIQDYIFASNRLRDAVGGSELVAQATSTWVFDALDKSWKTNLKRLDSSVREIDPNLTMEGSDLTVELLYSGGGNAFLLFRANDATEAAHVRQWADQLAARVLTEAPGLRIAVAWSEAFDWNPDAEDLSDRSRALIEGPLATQKRSGVRSVPLLGLGVTATCTLTGLPAVDVDSNDNNRLVSRNIAARRQALPQADKRFRSLLEGFLRHELGFQIPYELDDLGRTRGESSYIAVVHADGNGMGKRFLDVWKERSNRAAVNAIRELSAAVNRAGEQALLYAFAGVITRLGTLVEPFEKSPDSAQKDQETSGGGKKKTFLPFRPIIYGGDDATFVCDGRIGIELAARYLAAFERVTAGLPGNAGNATARAGVAIVKTHYPFRRAYDLSEELADSAKQALTPESSALDWHIAASGLLGDLDRIREREYALPEHRTLTMRPLPLHSTTGWRSWTEVRNTLLALQKDEWAGRRNKVKALREALRSGPISTEQFLRLYRLPQLPGYPGGADELRRTGFHQGVCGYFDPIELIDTFIPLQEAME